MAFTGSQDAEWVDVGGRRSSAKLATEPATSTSPPTALSPRWRAVPVAALTNSMHLYRVHPWLDDEFNCRWCTSSIYLYTVFLCSSLPVLYSNHFLYAHLILSTTFLCRSSPFLFSCSSFISSKKSWNIRLGRISFAAWRNLWTSNRSRPWSS